MHRVSISCVKLWLTFGNHSFTCSEGSQFHMFRVLKGLGLSLNFTCSDEPQFHMFMKGLNFTCSGFWRVSLSLNFTCSMSLNFTCSEGSQFHMFRVLKGLIESQFHMFTDKHVNFTCSDEPQFYMFADKPQFYMFRSDEPQFHMFQRVSISRVKMSFNYTCWSYIRSLKLYDVRLQALECSMPVQFLIKFPRSPAGLKSAIYTMHRFHYSFFVAEMLVFLCANNGSGSRHVALSLTWPVLELSNFRWGGWVFESPDQLAAERNLPIIIQQGRNHASKVRGVWIGRSPNRGREAPEIWGRSPNRGRSPRKSGGRGLGRGLGEPLPRNFLEFRTSNRSIWCIVERGIRK